MQLELGFVAQRSKSSIFEPAIHHYLDRIAAYAPIKSTAFRTQQALLASVSKQKTRTTACLVLLDSRGEALSSNALAAWIGKRRDSGQQAIRPRSLGADRARASCRALISDSPSARP